MPAIRHSTILPIGMGEGERERERRRGGEGRGREGGRGEREGGERGEGEGGRRRCNSQRQQQSGSSVPATQLSTILSIGTMQRRGEEGREQEGRREQRIGEEGRGDR